MKRTCQFLLIVFGVVLCQTGFAQFTPDVSRLVTPPASPEAAAFAKYGNTAVSHFSGTPNVSVPLGSVKGRSIEIPLTLTYDASGVKVEQIATWVGLGWNLSLGGVVTRMAKGLPDDYSYSQPEYSPYYSTRTAAWLHTDTDPNTTNYFYQYFLDHTMTSFTNPLDEVYAYRDYLNAKEAGKVDFQPDLYSFSVNGLSGTMFIDYELGIAKCLEHPDYVIVPDLEYVPGGLGDSFGVRELTGWTITDNKGNVYEFKQAEKTEFDDHMDNDVNGAQTRHFNSAWYCTKITTANGRDKVDFIYTTPAPWTNDQIVTGNESASFIGTESELCSQPSVNLPSSSATFKVWQFDLTAVKINNQTRVLLDRSSSADPREDLEGKSKLLGLRIFNPDGSNNNHIVFDQSYFTNGGSRERDKRLRLNGVRMLGPNDEALTDASMLQEYTFSYFEEETIPARDSYAQDYWGYFNGISANESKGVANGGTLIPADPGFDFSGFTGADRTVSFDHAITGTLKEVQYPTGGSTEFFYQPNYVSAKASGTSGVASSYHDVIKAMAREDGEIDSSPDWDVACGGETDYITNNAPTITTNSFVLEDGDLYTAHYQLFDDNVVEAYDELEFAFLYKGTEKTLCELMAGYDDPDVLFWDTEEPDWYNGTGPNAEGGKKPVFLEAGVQYHILVASNSHRVELSVYRNELVVANSSSSYDSEPQVEVGGFRVYKIQDRPDPTSIAKTRYFYYDKLSSKQLPALDETFFRTNTASSGVLQVPLDFIAPANRRSMNGSGVKHSCSYVQRLATNQYPSKGSIVTYSQVTETVSGDDEYNGFTVSEFYNSREATRLPYKKDFKNGRLRRQSIYDADLNILKRDETDWEVEGLDFKAGFYLASELSGIYNLIWVQAVSGANPIPDSYGIYYAEMGATGTGGSSWSGTNRQNGAWASGSSGGTFPARCDLVNDAVDCLKSGEQTVFEKVNYGVTANWIKMVSQTETVFNKSGHFKKTTSYTYNDKSTGNFNLRETSTTDSKGDVFITRFFYPEDLVPAGQNMNIYTDLVSQNRVSQIVKTQRIKVVDGVETVLQEQQTEYKEEEHSEDITPDWKLYAVNGGGLEQRIQFLSHDSYGNPIWVIKDGVESVQYRWENGSVPTVKLTGGYTPQYVVDEDTKEKIPIGRSFYVHDSFEYGGANTSTVGADEYLPSGNRYYDLGPNDLSYVKMDPGANYVLSFWAKGAGNITLTRKPDTEPVNSGAWTTEDLTITAEWKYYEFDLTAVEGFMLSATTASLDELRVHSKESQMTTYAYDGAERLITEIGPKGIPIHYEYDVLGRLSIVRDHKGNIIRLVKYGFKSVINE